MLQAIIRNDDIHTIIDKHCRGAHAVRINRHGTVTAPGKQYRLIANQLCIATRIDAHR